MTIFVSKCCSSFSDRWFINLNFEKRFKSLYFVLKAYGSFYLNREQNCKIEIKICCSYSSKSDDPSFLTPFALFSKKKKKNKKPSFSNCDICNQKPFKFEPGLIKKNERWDFCLYYWYQKPHQIWAWSENFDF